MIFASIPRHTAPNAADPASVIRSTTCAGGINGATGGVGINSGGLAGGAEARGVRATWSGISVSFSRGVRAEYETDEPQRRKAVAISGTSTPG